MPFADVMSHSCQEHDFDFIERSPAIEGLETAATILTNQQESYNYFGLTCQWLPIFIRLSAKQGQWNNCEVNSIARRISQTLATIIVLLQTTNLKENSADDVILNEFLKADTFSILDNQFRDSHFKLTCGAAIKLSNGYHLAHFQLSDSKIVVDNTSLDTCKPSAHFPLSSRYAPADRQQFLQDARFGFSPIRADSKILVLDPEHTSQAINQSQSLSDYQKQLNTIAHEYAAKKKRFNFLSCQILDTSQQDCAEAYFLRHGMSSTRQTLNEIMSSILLRHWHVNGTGVKVDVDPNAVHEAEVPFAESRKKLPQTAAKLLKIIASAQETMQELSANWRELGTEAFTAQVNQYNNQVKQAETCLMSALNNKASLFSVRSNSTKAAYKQYLQQLGCTRLSVA